MRVQLISDTHGKHHEMSIDETVDVIIHAGDSTNYYDIVNNEVEFENFLSWYSALNIKHKILIAGNHDAWAVRSWIHFIKLRDDGHAQKEAQLIARAIKDILIVELPVISKALGW